MNQIARKSAVFATTETAIWSGGPSQAKNLGYFLICSLFFFLVVPMFLMLWMWLQTNCTKYELTNERLIVQTGVLSKSTSQIELYRVRDYQQFQSLYYRVFGLSDVTVISTDKTNRSLVLSAVKEGSDIISSMRQCVESLRRTKPRIF